MQEFFTKQFVEPGLINETMQRERKIEVRFAFREFDVVSIS